MVRWGQALFRAYLFLRSLIYIVGILLGPYGVGLIELRDGCLTPSCCSGADEIVVIVSVFGCGLKIIRPLKLRAWDITVRLIGC